MKKRQQQYCKKLKRRPNKGRYGMHYDLYRGDRRPRYYEAEAPFPEPDEPKGSWPWHQYALVIPAACVLFPMRWLGFDMSMLLDGHLYRRGWLECNFANIALFVLYASIAAVVASAAYSY